MPVLNISKVSASLSTLIKKQVSVLIANNGLISGWNEEDLSVSLQPPEQLKGKYTIGLYLYHISEDAHFKNLPEPNDHSLPLRYTPMGVNLYYQVTAHSDPENDPNVSMEIEQLLMGLVVKVMRDYPILNKLTEIDGEMILDDELAEDEDRLRIVLQPIPHNDAVSFWTAGKSPLRLAAYYQVSVVLLEPEVTQSRTGRVLSYGAYSFVSGTPRLEISENIISFNLDPTGTQPPQEVIVRPAQVPLGSEVKFKGSSLGGDQRYLVLNNARWEREGVVEDSAWNVNGGDGLVTATVQSMVQMKPEALSTTRTETLVPGIYAASVRVVNGRVISDGSIRQFEHTSNVVPFMISPRVDGPDVIAPTAGGLVTVEGYGLEHPDLPSHAERMYVAQTLLERGISGSLSQAQYAIASTNNVDPNIPDDPQTLELVIPGGLPSGTLVPLRIVVNGAESPPKWIQIP
jgi:hypothetical protein